jgi:hypothetical protein
MNEASTDSTVPTTDALLRVSDSDRARLAEAVQELLAHGSILGLEAGQSALYHWCRQNLELLRDVAALTGLDVFLHHDERMVQGLPRVPALQLHLRQDATLVWLALWYVADVRWRDEGQPQALLTVGELNGVLKDTLLPDLKGLPAEGRLREILRQAARYNLIDFHSAEPFEESGIEILSAIRRVVPFRDIADWTETASTFKRAETENPESTTLQQ